MMLCYRMVSLRNCVSYILVTQGRAVNTKRGDLHNLAYTNNSDKNSTRSSEASSIQSIGLGYLRKWGRFDAGCNNRAEVNSVA
jgi:hypothetical protein